ncbi:MAG: hypothetical protein Kow0090_02420 [Myxococcota bacterium]
MRPQDKERIVVEVTRRVLEENLARAAGMKEAYIDTLIHETIYFEQRRIDTDPYSLTIEEDRKWISGLRSRFKRASEKEKKEILGEIIERHTREVSGYFSPAVYKLTTKVIPIGLGVMLNGFSAIKLLKSIPHLPDVSDNILIQGAVEQAKTLDKKGTIILVPTHASNLDSVAIGYSLYKVGLPPFTYGAGLNLFHHRIFGFFMHRLGAYKVDRLKKHSLYKDVLKEYATVSLEMGYHNLFFPGGTRSRSGAIEQKLKLGLLGCGIKAYYNNLKNGKEPSRLWVIPLTINYQLVLEAETLIEDHLKEAGKSRYIIEDDEFSMPGRIYTFIKNLVTLDAKIYIKFGRALDLFGNDVDDEGESLDGVGRRIDPAKYLYRKGELVEDDNRDKEYTQELARNIVESYKRNSVIFSTNVLAWTVFDMISRLHPDPDFYRFLRETGYQASIPMVDVYKEVEKTLKLVKKLAAKNKLTLSETLAKSDAEETVDNAFKLFGTYHTKPVVVRRGDRLFPSDMNLIYYYRNRLWGYGLERMN